MSSAVHKSPLITVMGKANCLQGVPGSLTVLANSQDVPEHLRASQGIPGHPRASQSSTTDYMFPGNQPEHPRAALPIATFSGNLPAHHRDPQDSQRFPGFPGIKTFFPDETGSQSSSGSHSIPVLAPTKPPILNVDDESPDLSTVRRYGPALLDLIIDQRLISPAFEGRPNPQDPAWAVVDKDCIEQLQSPSSIVDIPEDMHINFATVAMSAPDLFVTFTQLKASVVKNFEQSAAELFGTSFASTSAELCSHLETTVMGKKLKSETVKKFTKAFFRQLIAYHVKQGNISSGVVPPQGTVCG
ncbi:hypothetical protein FA13DRAFT_1716605 [Coprinellus micaceus]|uniref:Uncharacterized protein n=1 Tax=Coprinellus micaceus TaxID=71717 RepID=A0A4Y7SJ46_COPMI|nr:hypothetical protein FA13DRAFT_1716605 [Coprinellus micaceus]